MTAGQLVMVGSFNIYFFRVVILAGLVRIIARRDIFRVRPGALDVAVILWVSVLLIVSFFRDSPTASLTTGLGDAGNTAVAYVVFRALIRNIDDIWEVTWWLVGILTLLSAAMFVERVTGHNAFEAFGAAATAVRNDTIRAAGPFRHAILAGSAGAALVPLMAAYWLRAKHLSIIGVSACVLVAYASGSSGPLLVLLAGSLAMCLRRYSRYRRVALWSALAVIVLLQMVMTPNVWYLMARVDIVGGSTGWHRAYLIDQALAHFGEWWLAGTDRTRHWMPTGVNWSEDHSDITNHYLWLGVKGGLALVLAHVGVLVIAFKNVGTVRAMNRAAPTHEELVAWALGSVLFTHAVNSWTVAYFDHSVVLVYFILACIGSLASTPSALSRRSAPVLARSAPHRAARHHARLRRSVSSHSHTARTLR